MTWLLPLVWLYLATTRIRHAPLFAVMASVTLADLFPQTRWAAWLEKHRPDMYQPPTELEKWDWRAAVLPAVLVVVGLILQAARTSDTGRGPRLGPARSGGLAGGVDRRPARASR